MRNSLLASLSRVIPLMGAAIVLVGCDRSSDEPVTQQSAPATEKKPAMRTDDFSDLSKVVAESDFSEEGLDKLAKRVKQFVTDGDAGGINTLLVKDGQIVQYVEAGVQNEERQTPITQDTIFRIYSMTKPIVGAAIMTLVEQGKIDLDDPLSKHVPELAGMRVVGPPKADGTRDLVDADREPTIAELMAHTAGMSYGFADDDPLATYYRENQVLGAPDLETFIDRLSSTPLLFQPGTDWNYSVAVDVQGAIIERISGKSLGEFLDEVLFDPLGMTDTGFRVPSEDFDRMAEGYLVDPASGALVRLSEEQINNFGVVYREGAPLFESGGYGLASTMKDYAKFCQMLANGGVFDGNRILKKETIDLMRTNVLPTDKPLVTPGLLGDNGKPGTGFGLNFGVVYDAEASPTPYGQGSYFWGGLASTWFWIDPENDLFFIGMVQVYPAAAPVADFRRITGDIIYEALK